MYYHPFSDLLRFLLENEQKKAAIRMITAAYASKNKSMKLPLHATGCHIYK
jgi:hypothetical protein